MAYPSINVALISWVILLGSASFNRKTDSITASSVEVVSRPVKAHQSLTTSPAPSTELPQLTVPAYRTKYVKYFFQKHHIITYH